MDLQTLLASQENSLQANDVSINNQMPWKDCDKLPKLITGCLGHLPYAISCGRVYILQISGP